MCSKQTSIISCGPLIALLYRPPHCRASAGLGNKIYEITEAPLLGPDFTVVRTHQGPDLYNKVTGGYAEHKHVSYNSETGQVQVQFRISRKGKTKAEKLNITLSQLEEKCNPHGIALVLRFCEVAPATRVWLFSGRFFVEYLSQLPFTLKKAAWTICSKRCGKCNTFHKYDRLQKYSQIFMQRELTDGEWDLLLEPDVTQCKE